MWRALSQGMGDNRFQIKIPKNPMSTIEDPIANQTEDIKDRH